MMARAIVAPGCGGCCAARRAPPRAPLDAATGIHQVPGKFYCFLASVLATRLRRVTEAHDSAEVQLPKGVEAPKDVASFLANSAYLAILYKYVQNSEFAKTVLNELDFIGTEGWHGPRRPWGRGGECS